ncbi:TonB-dependent receptor plug domain-containing protein [Lutibacter holmesii]|uniref:TonB-dependent receptor plug domain-containing protein n=1 Tax=Lutibacter holmesii TaxID=1137985 RepID=A0ABW3WMT2_9FLAO
MKIKSTLLIVLLFCVVQLQAQVTPVKKDTVELKEVVITSNRISVPFSKTSRTINLISSEAILKSASTNVSDLLQNVTGVDVRRRGVDGMQSDLFIRGGNFNQTLLLIDGIKMDDVQTGHHTMNGVLSFDDIERIEVIKGPAARVYGQNAFTGAVNIVSKKVEENTLNVGVNYGSYNNVKVGASVGQKFTDGSVFASVSYQESDGYRYNTDFQNVMAFLKSNFKNYTLTTSFAQRNFGANGFYASPAYVDQYEETQTSLVAFSGDYGSETVKIKPRIYWRRNQDMYLFLRQDPDYYRNLHISNKLGVETNVEISSKLGKTGIGFDASRSFLVSNNLGDHNRTSFTGFVEQRFVLLNETLDITPGVAISSYSDFGTKAFPGIDIGYKVSDVVRIYGDIGYTYRVPTFTEMFYVGPTTIGNPDLEPESALSEEIGIKIKGSNINVNVALFNRKSENLIDWSKDNEEDKWETRNFSEVKTNGIETSVNYNFDLLNFNQNLQIAYTYINDEILDAGVEFTRYSLNSIKHQFNTGFNFQFCSIFTQNISYRYVERTDGESYNVMDARVSANLNNGLQLSFIANNIFNTEYTETNLVPMPKGNVMFGVKYRIY